MRHPCGSADHHHALDFIDGQRGIAQHLFCRLNGLADEVFADFSKGFAGEFEVDRFAAAQAHDNWRDAMRSQIFLGFTRTGEQEAGIFGRERLQTGAFENPAENAMVEIVAPEGGVAAGRQDFEHAAREPEDRQVKGAAAEVIDGIDAFGFVVQTIGDGGCRWFVQEAQYRESGEFGRILGGLTLCIVEISRDGDHRADQHAAKRSFGSITQRTQDVGGNLDRTFDAGGGLDAYHARRVLEQIRQAFPVRDVGNPAAHEALGRTDDVARIKGLARQGVMADDRLAFRQIVHHRRQQGASEAVTEYRGLTAANRRDQ